MASAEAAGLFTLKNSSQESIHSFHSTQSTQNSGANAQLSSELHTAAIQQEDSPFQSVDAFLNDPATQALANSSVNSNKQKASKSKQPVNNAASSSASEPVQIGAPKTHHYVPLLYHESQQRGYVPDFEYEEDVNGFGGSVTVNGQTFSSDLRWPNKKEAKEGLAKMAVPFVKAMEHRNGVASATQENWVGKLQEYHNFFTPTEGPAYTEYILPGPTFACTCMIPNTSTTFGSKELGFSNKKAARTNAAREAMQHVIAQGLTNPDGSLKTKKKAKFGMAIKVEDPDSPAKKKSATYAQKVNDLSIVLGVGAPFYQLSSQPVAPSLFSGAAHFTNTPIFTKPVGEVRNVYGKKNAKEECARGVWDVLKELAKKRGLDVDDDSEGF